MAKDPNNLLYGPRRRGPGPNTNRRPEDLPISEIETWTDVERESFKGYFSFLLKDSIDFVNQRHDYNIDVCLINTHELMVVLDRTETTGTLFEVSCPDGLYMASDKLSVEASQRTMGKNHHWITDYESEVIDIKKIDSENLTDDEFFVQFIILPALYVTQTRLKK